MRTNLLEKLRASVGGSSQIEVCAAAIDLAMPEARTDASPSLPLLCARKGIAIQRRANVHFDGELRWIENERPQITLRQGIPEVRARFILAHELGHWVVQHVLGDRQQQLFKGIPLISQEAEEEELIADALASEILMPARLIKASFGENVSHAIISKAIDQFRVSTADVLRRYSEVSERDALSLTLVPRYFGDLTSMACIDDGWHAHRGSIRRATSGFALPDKLTFKSFGANNCLTVTVEAFGRRNQWRVESRFVASSVMPKVTLVGTESAVAA